MPHVVIEYSGNLDESINFNLLFNKIHLDLVKKLNIEINVCRSRAIKQEKFCIGNGDTKNAHIHLNVAVLEGHSLSILEDLGSALVKFIKEESKTWCIELNLQITCEIREISNKLYFKT